MGRLIRTIGLRMNSKSIGTRGALAASIAVGVLGATMVGSVYDANAANWYSSGDGYGSVFASMCDSGICFGSSHQVRQAAEVLSEATAVNGFTFTRDRFGTTVSGLGPSSAFQSCISIGIDHVEHASPNLEVFHERSSVWPWIGSSSDLNGYWYTANYKEANVSNPVLKHSTYLYDQWVCPIWAVPLYTQVYKG